MNRIVFETVAVLAAAWTVFAGPTPENGITAHRGDSVNFPENSLAAFASANAIGADWIETDVYLTKDAQFVLSHNPTTGAYSSKNLSIAGSTYAELAALDMAEKFLERSKKTLAQCPKLKILRFEEALDYILREKKARLSIQPKNDSVLHEAGFKVGVWTVNEPAELARFLDMGIDRIYTDVPATLKEIKAKRH